MSDEEYLNFVSKKTGISAEEIAGAYEDQGGIFVFAKSHVVNHLQNFAPQINKSFDSIYEAELRNISSDLSEVMPQVFVKWKKARHDNDELKVVCGYLLTDLSLTEKFES